MGLIKIPDNSITFFKENLNEIFRSGNLAEGKWNKEISEFTKSLTDAVNAIPTNSNGSGMVALLTYYRHYNNRTKVLIQSNTMYGVKTMVFAGGCQLEGYIGCKLQTLMPSIEDVKNSINRFSKDEKKQLIVLLSHIGGIINPDIQKIAEFCRSEDIILLEDCAHSFGATLDGIHSGLFGDAGVYSFYATKAIPAGEGGVVVTKIKEVGEAITDYSIYDRFQQKLEVGNNIRISEVQALLTYSIIREWNQVIDNKRRIAEKYMIACEEKGIQYIAQNTNGHDGNYYKFIIYHPKKNINEAYPNIKTTTSQVYDYDIGVDNEVAGYHACLPIWYGLEDEVVEKVLNELSIS